MALVNYSLPFAQTISPYYHGPTATPTIQVDASGLLYSPDGHQQSDLLSSPPSQYQNNPYSPPKQRGRAGTQYLPPYGTFKKYGNEREQYRTEQQTNYYNQPSIQQPYHQQQQQQQQNNRFQQQYYRENAGEYRDAFSAEPQATPQFTDTYHSLTGNSGHYETEKTRQSRPHYENVQFKNPEVPKPTPAPAASANLKDGYPVRPPGFTKVDTRQFSGSGQPGKTQLHAVLDYDDDYYDDAPPDANMNNNGGSKQSVTPLQGPILIKNGSVPVVPLFSYPVVNNGSLVQIPILWTALSLALGLELKGQIVKGVPCVKRHHQLFCPAAGNTYPLARIESFIDENKALMKRMYGDFTVYTEYGPPKRNRKRRNPPGVPDILQEPSGGDSYFRKVRQTNPQTSFPNNRPPGTASAPPAPEGNSTRVDACESKTEIVTPYWALNSAGKVRAVVNTMHFEQAIHQEVCSKTQTNRCSGDCGCEQKYKWHRLLAYDPNEDCSGIFMDWFLFPSCCVCRCNPL